ncbi:Neuropeptide Y receptor [Blomia tropicalis]|nr:Neuropeptide Y receptor [Blomia tropicalis]
MSTSTWQDLWNNILYRYFGVIIFYGLIIIVAMCGNLMVCRVALHQNVRNSTNYLIANLAISDLMMTIINIPTTVIDLLLHDWPFGNLLCTLVPLLQAICVYVSSFSMLSIAINRFYVVYHRQQCNRRRSYPTLKSTTTKCVSNTSNQSSPSTMMMVVIVDSNDRNSLKNQNNYGKNQNVSNLIAALIYLRIGFTISRLGMCHNRPIITNNNVIVENNNNEINEKKSNHSSNQLAISSTQTSVRNINPGGSALSSPSSSSMTNGIDRREQILLNKRRRILLLAVIVSIHAFAWLPFHIYFILRDASVIRESGPLFLVVNSRQFKFVY